MTSQPTRFQIRYASDPDFRERHKESNRRARAKSSEAVKEIARERNRRYHRENRAKINARQKANWALNSERIQARRRAHEAANPVPYRDYQRRYNLLRNYGLTVAAYQVMHDAQQGVCAICGQPETAMRRGRLLPLHVDHAHGTTRLRALLCRACNQALGIMGDDPVRVRRMAEYLEDWSALEESSV